MAAFEALRDVSKNFEEELHRVSTELFTAKVGETFEDGISKKLSDLSLFTSKLRLLRAKTLSLRPEIPQQARDGDSTFNAYEDTAVQKIIEQQLVKSALQAKAVKALLTATDSTLEPEMLDRKKKIIASLSEYREQEATLQHLEVELKDREEKLATLADQWDRELAAMKDMAGSGVQHTVDVNERLHKKLSMYVEKLETMRLLVNRLGLTRSSYDWLGDPHRRLQAIKRARQPYSMRYFTEES